MSRKKQEPTKAVAVKKLHHEVERGDETIRALDAKMTELLGALRTETRTRNRTRSRDLREDIPHIWKKMRLGISIPGSRAPRRRGSRGHAASGTQLPRQGLRRLSRSADRHARCFRGGT